MREAVFVAVGVSVGETVAVKGAVAVGVAVLLNNRLILDLTEFTDAMMTRTTIKTVPKYKNLEEFE